MAELTNNIIVAKNNFTKHLYFKEDIECLIDKLIDCIKAEKKDTEQDVRANILRIFKYYDISCKRNLTPEEYKRILHSSPIPTFGQLSNICWDEMYKFNIVYKTPQEYLKRLVDNLASTEFNSKEAPSRVKILRQFLGNMNYLRETRWYSDELVEIVNNDYRGVIANIDDDIFVKYLKNRHYYKPHKLIAVILDVYGDVLYREGEQDDVLSELVAEFDSKVLGKTALELVGYLKENNLVIIERKKVYPINEFDPELCKKIAEHLQAVLKKYKEDYEETINEIKNIKNRADQFKVLAEFICENNLMKELVTKEFRKLVNSQTGAWIKPEMPDSEIVEILSAKADDRPRKFAQINRAIIKAISKIKKAKKEKYDKAEDNIREHRENIKILYVCDDLANGRFRKVAETKEILYLFAFAFDMSACPDTSQQDDFKYIRKNLFEDFYSDNIIRYINDFQKMGTYVEPTGISLQYKNFVEIVYLYWLNKESSKIPPYQKYLHANEMIMDIVKKYKEAQEIVEEATDKESSEYLKAKRISDKKAQETFVYRYYFEGTKDAIKRYGDYYPENGELLDKKEDELVNFILMNYDIDTDKDYEGDTIAQAFENQSHQTTAEKVFDIFVSEIEGDSEASISHYYYALDFCEPIFDSEKEKERLITDDYRRLKKLINKVNEQIESVLSDIDINGNNKYTRTRLMILYYTWFIRDRYETNYSENFDDFYDEYVEQLNENLEICSYQLFSNKNLIDVMLMYSAFIVSRA